MDEVSLQKEVNRLVNRGIILGTVWIMGIGSIISLVSAYQANKIISTSVYNLQGKDKVIKCFLIGIAGLLVWIASIAIIILFKKK